MPDDSLPDQALRRRLRQVDRAVSDLRRGEMVRLVHDGADLVLVAAETLTSEDLARLARLTGRQVSLALTRRRAALLGRAPAAEGPGGTVVMPMPEGSEVEFLRQLADPAADPGTPQASGPPTVPQ